MVDELIRRRGLDAPPAAPDEHDAPVELDPPPSLDLRAGEFGAVVWCTGFGGDFAWLGPRLAGAGQPLREDAAAPAPGVWYLGLRWLTRRCSGIPLGFPGDAAGVADAIAAYLRAGTAYRNASRPAAS